MTPRPFPIGVVRDRPLYGSAVTEAQRLFAQGYDTHQIARRFQVRECHVYNALARAREKRRAA